MKALFRGLPIAVGFLGCAFVSAGIGLAAGLQSAGNTDGVLTWRLGSLAKGQWAREVVLFAFANSPDAAAQQVEAARRQFARLRPSATGSLGTPPKGQV
jgi:hypothetical protein